jgi:FMN phosphatase YigB (HAD superfamily)
MMAIPWRGIRLLIIDLDNTLCDTLHTLSKKQWTKVSAAFRRRGWVREARVLDRELGKYGFLHTLQKAGLSEEQIRFAIRIYDKADVRTLKLFPDAKALLGVPLHKALLSRGEQRLQRRKIRHLKIAVFFDDIHITPTFQGKEDALRAILQRHRVRPREALVIGDRVEEEISAAKRLRIPCVLVRRPDWPIGKHRVKPDLVVRDLRIVANRLREEKLKNRA